jgi:hypothetical protein
LRELARELGMVDEEMKEAAHGVGGGRAPRTCRWPLAGRRWWACEAEFLAQFLAEKVAKDRIPDVRQKPSRLRGVAGTRLDGGEGSTVPFKVNKEEITQRQSALEAAGKAFRTFSRKERVGIFPLRQLEIGRTPFGSVEGQESFETATCRPTSGLVTVKAEDHTGIDTEKTFGLDVGEGRSKAGHHRIEPRLGEGEDVHVAFDDDERTRLARGEACLVLAVEKATFVKEQTFWGIEVLGLLIRIEGPPTKTDGPPPCVPDREEETVPEEIDRFPATATDEAGLLEKA